MRVGWLAAAVSASVALVGLAPVSSAQDQVILALAATFIPPVIATDSGQALDFQNSDVLPHDVVAQDVDDKGNPIFRSPVTSGGARSDVVGVEKLAAGAYPFFCSLHPWMNGVLQVTLPGGIPPPVTPVPDAGAVGVSGAVPTPTSVEVFDGNVYATSYVTGNVFALPILAEGVLGPATPYATGFTNPLGVTFAPDGTMFVADSHPSTRTDRTTAGRVTAIAPGGGDVAEVGQMVVDELPNGRHNTNGMSVRGGRLYVANGNSSDDGVEGGETEEPLSGSLVSVPVGARGLVIGGPNAVLPSGLTVEATGMRNVYDVAFRPGTSEAWLPTNGPDAQDPWGEDLLHRVDVAGGPLDMGFPECVYRAGPGGPTEPVFEQNTNPDVTEKCAAGSHHPPEVTLGLHTSADGLAFGPQPEWGGDLYIAQFGNFNGSAIVGHKIVRVPMGPGGVAGAPVDVLVSVTPLDLTFGPPGTGMYVADFGAGQILLVKPL
ncbi:MAG TPA: hypothetical protein VMY88_00495 [Acidimicrobiales bacterium]|nr:hypothetical protein [Acidimicrobiales bacterium]